jgi:hypothetical protein
VSAEALSSREGRKGKALDILETAESPVEGASLRSAPRRTKPDGAPEAAAPAAPAKPAAPKPGGTRGARGPHG